MDIDGAFRALHARIHSAGHLLDMAMMKAGRKDLKPGKGYHFVDGPYVEYVGVVKDDERDKLIEQLNFFCAEMIKEAKENDTKVFRKMCTYEEAGEHLSGIGGVPPYIPVGNDLRVLKLTPQDLGCPCGGTHVHAIAELGKVEITKMKKKKQNTQVSYKVLDA
jgi:Ser-tRNA(Ala) deacylase AlaX